MKTSKVAKEHQVNSNPQNPGNGKEFIHSFQTGAAHSLLHSFCPVVLIPKNLGNLEPRFPQGPGTVSLSIYLTSVIIFKSYHTKRAK